MQCFLVSDDDLISGKVRQALLREGLDCPASNVVRLDFALPRLAAPAQPDLIVVVLSPIPERGQAVLAKLRGQTQAQMLAVGPVSDLQLILHALRGGADDSPPSWPPSTRRPRCWT
jgi:DNA-binding response OmpR family regulator